MTTSYGAQRLEGIGGKIQLPLVDDKHIGCWQFALTLARTKDPLTAAIAPKYAELATLDIGFRIFFVDPLFSSDPSLFGSDACYQSLRYPLLDEAAAHRYPADITLQGCWDPLNRDRSFFSFAPLVDNTLPSLPSGYRSNLGYTVYLTPQNNTRLVFASKPASSLADSPTPNTNVATGLYLVPQGEFELTVPRHEDNSVVQIPGYDNNLKCGLSGVEYIKFPGNQPETVASYIGFKPNQPAFAARYTPSQELTQRLRDLVSGYAQPPIAQLQKGNPLISLLSQKQAEEMLSILLGEFFPQGYQLPEKEKLSLEQLFRNELSILTPLTFRQVSLAAASLKFN